MRTVSWQMEQLVDELPLYLLRLNEFSSLIDERMDFGTFKFWDETQCCSIEINLTLLLKQHQKGCENAFYVFLSNTVTAISEAQNSKWLLSSFVFMATFIENVLAKFCAHRDTLRPFLDRACSLIQSDSFTSGLIDLGLLENPV